MEGYVRCFGLSNYLDIKYVQIYRKSPQGKLSLCRANFQGRGDVVLSKGSGG